MNTVFAICERAEPVYGFFHVYFEKNGQGTFVRVPDAVKSYPSKGAIWVGKDVAGGPFEDRAYGVFEIADAQSAGSSARYMATKVHLSARQIVQVPFRSTEFDAVHDQLVIGLEILHQLSPKSQILIHFIDGVVAGPFELRNRFDRHQVYNAACDELSLQRPKRAWKSIHAETVKVAGKVYQFFLGELPEAEFYLDYSSKSHALKVALEHFVTLKRIGGLLSVRKSRELAQQLAGIPVAGELRAHVQRLVPSIKDLEILGADLDALVAEAKENPDVRKRIDAEVQQAKKEAADQAKTELTESNRQLVAEKHELTKLRSKKTEVEGQVAVAQKSLNSLQAEITDVAAKLSAAIKSELAHAESDVFETLAKSSIYKQLISPAAATASPRTSQQPYEVISSSAAQDLATPKAAVAHLTTNLVAIGLRPPQARDISLITISALSSGAAVSFRGSMARCLAQTVAVATFGKEWVRTEVEIGAADQRSFGGVRRILFLGANRSCPDAYAAEVVNGCRPAQQKDPLLAIFEISEAQSALPPSLLFSEIGPVIHTDALAWVMRDVTSPVPGDLKPLTLVTDTESAKVKARIDSALQSRPNASVKLHLARQLAVLPTIFRLSADAAPSPESVDKNVERLLVLWWVLPYLAAQGATKEALSEFAVEYQAEAPFGNLLRLMFSDNSSEPQV